MYNNQYQATCYFLDVGQGTSQVIYLGEHRAIIVDTGSRREKNQSPLSTLLLDLDVQIIEALILSHNDYDHVGDVKNVIDKYQRCIRKICFVDDRSLDKNNTYKTIIAAERSCYIERKQIVRLEAGEHKDIFDDGSVTISVLYPDLLANLELNRNDTCAVISLTVGDQKIIFFWRCTGWSLANDNCA
jgi:beta-lactamase superfamily II metal-dependent hydrolase